MMLRYLLSVLFVASLAIALQILVMIYGWGLEPRSWLWIIGGGVFGVTVLRGLLAVVEKEKV